MRPIFPCLSLLLLALSLLVGLCGCGTPSFLITPVQNSNELDETQVQPGQGLFPDKIVIIPIEGELMDANTGGILQPAENPLSVFTQEMDQAAADSGVKAIVLRVNSPGGTVTCSDTMYQIVQRFKQQTHKPVIASVQEVGASGAYYVSCAADKIIASPTSIVGSIGVIFENFNFEGTLAKIGAEADSVKSGRFKDMGSPYKAPDPADRALMQNLVNEYFARFVSVVTSHRPIHGDETIKRCTDGRVFSGEEALTLGLVDQTGLLDDAITQARQMAGAPNAKVVEYKHSYDYGGSIYALNSAPPPHSNVVQFNLLEAARIMPSGFYFLWQP